MNINVLKAEIDRSYRLLGPDKGEMQNLIDLRSWKAERFITQAEYEQLVAYSRSVYKDMLTHVFVIRYGNGTTEEYRGTYAEARVYAADHAHGWGFGIYR